MENYLNDYIEDYKSKRPVALVTGSSKGIGRGIAVKLASMGYDIIVNYKTDNEAAAETAAMVEAAGQRAMVIKADVGNYEAVEKMFEKIYSEYPSLDILVNNAGIARYNMIQDVPLQDWADVMNTNVNGMFYCTKLAIDRMLSNHSGKILNITSIWGIVGAAMETSYATSKGAIISFTKSLAKECGFSGIQVNAIAPGAVDTPMLKDLDKEVLKEVISETPFQRLGTVEDIAELAGFILSDKGAFLQGQTISPNGGLVIS